MKLSAAGISPRLAVASEKCPYWPLQHPALMLPHSFIAREQATRTRMAAGPSDPLGQVEAGYRISLDRTRHKRGPPALELLQAI